MNITWFILNAVFMKLEHAACFLVAGLFASGVFVWRVYHFYLTSNSVLFFFLFYSSAFKMASILQKLITPLFSGPPDPPRNKVTVVGVGQVGMACAISILLRVRAPLPFHHFYPRSDYPPLLLVSQDGVIPRILLDWHRITDLLVSDLGVIPLTVLVKVW